MSNHDYRSDLEEFTAMWDEMEKEGDFPPIEKAKPSPWAAEILGATTQDTYYDYMDSEEMLQEQKTPNPIYPDSVGKDSDKPDPVWVDDKLLKELESVKKRLFQVENRVARMGQGSKWTEKAVSSESKSDKLMSEIESLRSRCDKLSNTLGIKNEPSPWQTKDK